METMEPSPEGGLVQMTRRRGLVGRRDRQPASRGKRLVGSALLPSSGRAPPALHLGQTLILQAL